MLDATWDEIFLPIKHSWNLCFGFLFISESHWQLDTHIFYMSIKRFMYLLILWCYMLHTKNQIRFCTHTYSWNQLKTRYIVSSNIKYNLLFQKCMLIILRSWCWNNMHFSCSHKHQIRACSIKSFAKIYICKYQNDLYFVIFAFAHFLSKILCKYIEAIYVIWKSLLDSIR